MKSLNFNYLPVSILIFVLFFCFQLKAQRYAREVAPHYVFPAFSEGTVIMKTGKINKSQLNYNTITEEMIFEKNEQKLALFNLEYIDTVTLEARKFVPVGKVFYEVVFEATISLYIQHKSKLILKGKPTPYGGKSTTGAIDSYAQVMTSFGAYNLKLPDEYDVTNATVFWLYRNGAMIDFVSKKQFLKIFWQYKDELKQFIKKNKINFKEREDLIKLIGYCNEKMY